MAIGSPQWMYASGEDAFTIDQSLRFNDDDSPYLSWTPSSAGTEETWTFSCWVKRGNLGSFQGLLAVGTVDGSEDFFGFNGEDNLYFRFSSGSDLKTNAVYRDSSAHYHIVLVADTTQSESGSTASDSRLRLYVNGEQVTSFSSGTMPSQDHTFRINTSAQHYLGEYPRINSHLDGYLSEVNFIDGQALTPSSFGETGDYGEWKPIEVSGLTYGTNGFYLDFADSGALGDDESGNTNDWTVNNLTASDQVVDSPTNNFCTMNPLAYNAFATVTHSEGNLKVSSTTDGSQGSLAPTGTMGVASGKWYWEVLAVDAGGSGKSATGIRKMSVNAQMQNSSGDNAIGNQIGDIALEDDGDAYDGGGGWTTNSYSSSFDDGDIINVAIDLDNLDFWFGINGTWVGGSNPAGSATKVTLDNDGAGYLDDGSYFTPSGCSQTGAAGVTVTMIYNFGQDSSFAGEKTAQGNQDGNGIGDFYYTPPTGFLALCTSNLPDVDVTPSEHFNTVAYTGTGANQVVTGVGFQPDFLWFKNRSLGYGHILLDTVRGLSAPLASESDDAEGAFSYVSSVSNDGFTTTSSQYPTNNTGSAIVAWNWKANGSGSSNTDGSITSTVSANTDAGFSIVSYTGNGTDGATVGHGLSKAPEIVIIKGRTGSGYPWAVMGYPTNPAFPYDGSYLFLDTTAGLANGAGSELSLGSSTITFVDAGANICGNSQTYIAYCFHSVEGYSKVGSYTGNGDADGTFVYTGFRPAWVMWKETSAGTHGWMIHDSTRSTVNAVDNYLIANSVNAEANHDFVDFTSNGFKQRHTSTWANGDDETYIYIAFAETPFKYSNAR